MSWQRKELQEGSVSSVSPMPVRRKKLYKYVFFETFPVLHVFSKFTKILEICYWFYFCVFQFLRNFYQTSLSNAHILAFLLIVRFR